jgi:DNA repair photolyase
METAKEALKPYCHSLVQYKRRKTIPVKVGDVVIGGDNPIVLQSMTTVDTMDTEGSIEQSIRMIEAGCQLVRITAPSKKEAENLRHIKEGLRKRGYNTPLVADIHFTPNAAELAAKIVEKVRVNPGNYADKKKFETIEYTDESYQAELERIRERFEPLVKICKDHGTAMRIGTNHGSLSDRIMSRYGDTPLGMVESALEFIRICEDLNYYDIVVSMKSSNPHEYWGFNAGLDFESKIIVKQNAPMLLEKELLQKNWKVQPVVLSGNTDCYQPLERKLRITRKLLEVFAKYRHPVAIITKNVGFLDDLDVLKELAKDNLIRVILSITSLDEAVRSKLEPRTASAKRKLAAIETLSQHNIPSNVMTAPIIPGINHHEIPEIIKAAATSGAQDAGYTVVRLNATIKDVFAKWLETHFPDRYEKVWNQISHLHGGKVNDSEWSRRMRGAGQEADMINQLFVAAKKQYMKGHIKVHLNASAFRKGGNYNLFN